MSAEGLIIKHRDFCSYISWWYLVDINRNRVAKAQYVVPYNEFLVIQMFYQKANLCSNALG